MELMGDPIFPPVCLFFFPLKAVTSNTLELCGRRRMKKRLPAPDLSEGSVKSGECPEGTSDGSLDINVDELETPSDSEVQDGSENGHEFEWEGEAANARFTQVGGA